MGEAVDRTKFDRRSGRELAVSRIFDASVHQVWRAWTSADLFMRWWAPKSMGMPMRACDMDVRAGGGYRIEFGNSAEESFAFFGKYLVVEANAKLVWTNEESGDAQVTTVTFEALGDKTLLVYSETYPTLEALDEACAGMEGAMPEQFRQLDELLAEVG